MKKFINNQIVTFLVILLLTIPTYLLINLYEEKEFESLVNFGKYNIENVEINNNEYNIELISANNMLDVKVFENNTGSIKFSAKESHLKVLIYFDIIIWIFTNIISIPIFIIQIIKSIHKAKRKNQIIQEEDISIPNYSIGLFYVICKGTINLEKAKDEIISYLLLEKYIEERENTYIATDLITDNLKKSEKYILDVCLGKEEFDELVLQNFILEEGMKLGIIKNLKLKLYIKNSIGNYIEKNGIRTSFGKEWLFCMLVFVFLGFIVSVLKAVAFILFGIVFLFGVYWFIFDGVLSKKGKTEYLKLEILGEILNKKQKAEGLTEKEKLYFNILKSIM